MFVLSLCFQNIRIWKNKNIVMCCFRQNLLSMVIQIVRGGRNLQQTCFRVLVNQSYSESWRDQCYWHASLQTGRQFSVLHHFLLRSLLNHASSTRQLPVSGWGKKTWWLLANRTYTGIQTNRYVVKRHFKGPFERFLLA